MYKIDKKTLRHRCRNLPVPSPEHRAQLSASIRTILQAAESFRSAELVALFAGRPFEVDLLPLVHCHPRKFCFPRVNVTTKQLEFFRIQTVSELVPGFHSILEPAGQLIEAVPSGELNLVLVPGIAFDDFGGRLGSGAGYYDRFFSGLPTLPIKWGIAFSAQISKERLAQDVTDVRMDAVCSELGIRNVP